MYGLVFSKNTNSLVKAQLMHVDLIDKNGHKTISVTIANHLIHHFRPYFSPISGICISNFTLKQKYSFERGDVETCIHFTINTIVERIPLIYPTHRLVPNTTIHDSWLSKSGYPIGSIVAIITSFQHNNDYYQLNIKDGESTNDTTTVSIPSFTFV